LQIHWYGLEGWRWLFILEEIPAVILGVVTFFYLTDWPSQASWLAIGERQWIDAELNREKKEKAAIRSYTIAQALRQREVILLTLIYFLNVTGFYGVHHLVPHHPEASVGILRLDCHVAGGTSLSHSADRDFAEWLAFRPNPGAALAQRRSLVHWFWRPVFRYSFRSHLWTQLGFFTIFTACVHAYQPCFWAPPTITLGESAAAASIALINSIGIWVDWLVRSSWATS
jgi:ACS family tartrate transporter-like MFS transporter